MSNSVLNTVIAFTLVGLSMTNSFAAELVKSDDNSQQKVSCLLNLTQGGELTSLRGDKALTLGDDSGDIIGCMPDDSSCEQDPWPTMLTLEQCSIQGGVATQRF
jgi:hypothetical protein